MSVFNLFSDRNMVNSKSTFQAIWRGKDLNPDFSNWVRYLILLHDIYLCCN